MTRLAGIGFDLFADPAHVHRHGCRVAVGVAPHFLEQLLAPKGPTRARREEHDEVELARGEGQNLLPAPGLSCRDVDLQIAGDQPVDAALDRDDRVGFHHEDVRSGHHHCDHIVTANARVQAACAANHGRSRLEGRIPERVAVASNAHGTNGSQMRSTSALDIPLRSASATTAKTALTSNQTRRSRRRASATATAGPVATAKSARSANKKYE